MENCKCDKEYINKLIDNNIVIKEEIPNKIITIISNLEECNKCGNWIDYQMYEDELETDLKNLIINNKISENLFNKLMKKYGRYIRKLKQGDDDMNYLSEQEILELKEKSLPKFLLHDIEEIKKYKNDKNCTFFDCLKDELYGSINAAQIDGIITKDFADYLRNKYLYNIRNVGDDNNE